MLMSDSYYEVWKMQQDFAFKIARAISRVNGEPL